MVQKRNSYHKPKLKYKQVYFPYKMEPYLYALISTYVPEQSKYLTFLAGGKLINSLLLTCIYTDIRQQSKELN